MLNLFIFAAALVSNSSGAPSLTFGEGENKVHVFVSSKERASRCGKNYLRFTAGQEGYSTKPKDEHRILSFVLWGMHMKTLDLPIAAKQEEVFPLYRMVGSPTKTRQMEYCLPSSNDTNIEDIRFEFLALKKICDQENCTYSIATQGSFTGAEVKNLEPSFPIGND